MVLLRWVCRALVALAVPGGMCGALKAQRLPRGVRPQHYSLTITPDLKDATFAGSERIDVALDAPARAITLNAAEIEFTAVRAWAGSGGSTQTAAVTLDPAKEQATFSFARELPPGPVTLAIEYRGILNSQLRGFYLSKTKMRSYGVTQFEATDARRAFPGFDEPALKATFDVTLVVDEADTAFSNMNAISDTAGPAGRHTVVFATTPKMSTYLVAWLVGDFACTRDKSDGVALRVCATPDKVRLTKFALDSAKWTLHFYDRYFGIRYPMTKLDLIAVPDFESGAMENFGCITFRETELLVDEKNGTLPARKDVTTTVAHEMAHQWFGDLVTPVWWDNLWLNEGFATWMETKAAAAQHPHWRFEEDAAADLSRTLDRDASAYTRPVRSQAETPAEINALFDEIVYGKAGAVLGMVENWIGEEAFRRGVRQYLAAHLYGNATAEDFWQTETRVSGLPVDAVMRSFVDQPGAPEVTPASGGPAMTQRRFLLPGSPVAADQQWTIPVCFKGAACQVLTPAGTPAAGYAAAARPRFVYANARAKGYYRTRYSAAESAAILAHAETDLSAAERIGLLGDRWALMQAGQANVGEVLDLALALKRDGDPAVLEDALADISAIESRLATGDDRIRLQAVIRRELAAVYAERESQAKHESYNQAEIREAMFEALGTAGDPVVLAQAESISSDLFSGQPPADANLGDAAVALTAPRGDAGMYDRLLAVVRRTGDPDLKETAMRALTRFEAPLLVARTLEFASSEEVHRQDSWGLLAVMLARPGTQDQAWDFIRQHWTELERKSTADSAARLVAATAGFCSAARQDEVAQFFRVHPVDAGGRTLARSLEKIDGCIRLRVSQQPELRTWLDRHAGP